MKKKLFKFLIWLCIFNVATACTLGLSFTKAKAAQPQDVYMIPMVQFTNTSGSGFENVADPKIEVSTSSVPTTDLSVDYSVTGGTAISGKNYQLNNGTLDIATGVTSANIPIKVLDDYNVGADVTVEITLSNPSTNAMLGVNKVYTYTILESDNAPRTSLTTTPSLPDGNDNWFKSAPQIQLNTSDDTNTTYYQWGDTVNKKNWREYIGPFVAPEGENNLFYFSIDKFNNYEKIKWQLFKVDTIAPQAPSVTSSVDDNGYVNLSWSAVPDAVSYNIVRMDSNSSVNLGNVVSYLDNTTVRSITYTYGISSVDDAGNISVSSYVSVYVPSIIVVPVASTTTSTLVKKATQSIASGASIQNPSSITPETSEAPQAVEGTSTPETTSTSSSGRDWSKLLLAISILVIAAGAAIGGYYGYEWWMEKKDDNTPKTPPKSKSRW